MSVAESQHGLVSLFGAGFRPDVRTSPQLHVFNYVPFGIMCGRDATVACNGRSMDSVVSSVLRVMASRWFFSALVFQATPNGVVPEAAFKRFMWPRLRQMPLASVSQFAGPSLCGCNSARAPLDSATMLDLSLFGDRRASHTEKSQDVLMFLRCWSKGCLTKLWVFKQKQHLEVCSVFRPEQQRIARPCGVTCFPVVSSWTLVLLPGCMPDRFSTARGRRHHMSSIYHAVCSQWKGSVSVVEGQHSLVSLFDARAAFTRFMCPRLHQMPLASVSQFAGPSLCGCNSARAPLDSATMLDLSLFGDRRASHTEKSQDVLMFLRCWSKGCLTKLWVFKQKQHLEVCSIFRPEQQRIARPCGVTCFPVVSSWTLVLLPGCMPDRFSTARGRRHHMSSIYHAVCSQWKGSVNVAEGQHGLVSLFGAGFRPDVRTSPQLHMFDYVPFGIMCGRDATVACNGKGMDSVMSSALRVMASRWFFSALVFQATWWRRPRVWDLRT